MAKVNTLAKIMSELKYKLVDSQEELQGAFRVRREVFVAEQDIDPEEEFDGLDDQALHMVVVDGPDVVAAARVRFLSDRQAKLERMAVLKPYRRRGIGTEMISYLIRQLRKRQVKEAVLHAQCAVIPFYRASGFVAVGPTFWEAGIEHIKMQKRLSR
jgi:predicted GNAT family N-acyltransferase